MRPPHYAEALAAGRRGEPAAGQALAKLVRDTKAPQIARAARLSRLDRHAANAHTKNVGILNARVEFYREMGNQRAARFYGDELRIISALIW